MSFVLGLTGSIGMGKSTTAKMFADAGCAVWDADAAVHRLYAPGGPAVAAVAEHYPAAIEGNAVSRDKLRDIIASDPKVLDHLQTIVHPLVAADRADFVKRHEGQVVVLDIPLLFEIGVDRGCDATVVVTTNAETQRRRVLERGEMTEQDFEMILARQMPDAEKRARATYIIETDTLEGAKARVAEIMFEITEGMPNA